MPHKSVFVDGSFNLQAVYGAGMKANFLNKIYYYALNYMKGCML